MELTVRIALLLITLCVDAKAWTHGQGSYVGIVATRQFISTNFDSGHTSAMSRSYHIARDTISSLQIVVPNWYVSNATFIETGSGGTLTITASVEYPANTFTQIKFGGSAAGSTSNLTNLISDVVAVSIPNGADFWIRIYQTNAAGVLYYFHSGAATQRGDALIVGGLAADYTLSGTGDNAGNINGIPGIGWEPGSGVQSFPPVAIIATTSKATVAIVGDSIAYGLQDATTATAEDWGEFSPTIGPSFAYANLAQSGDFASKYVLSNSLRTSIFQYVSSILFNYGWNDLHVGDSAATVLGHLQTVWATVPAGKQVFQSTITPWTTSTDSWATAGNQTIADNAVNTQRVSLNTSLRSGGSNAPANGIFDVADAFETSRNSGKWISNGTANFYTPDGFHPTFNADAAAIAGAQIDTTRIHR